MRRFKRVERYPCDITRRIDAMTAEFVAQHGYSPGNKVQNYIYRTAIRGL